tara:strand:- start:8073 stop:8489 length:417 start_codon:yes stop_codon:yes gene_type:complete
MIEQIFILLLIFQVKHWVCDYPLQTPFMLKKFQREDWEFPLFCHAGVHASFTLVIACIFIGDHVTPLTSWVGIYTMFLLAVLDLVVHFIVDRIKAHPDMGGRWKADNPKFWWALGGDQALHHLTHYVIIYVLVTSINY